MKKLAALGIDFGISKVHTNIISLEEGTLFAEYETIYSWDVLENDIGEIHPDKIWECAQNSVEQLLAKADLADIELSMLSFSCFGDCFVAVDGQGSPVYPMLLFSDMRAREVMDKLRGELSEKEYIELTGGPTDPGYVFSKIYWMKEKASEAYGQAKSFYNIQQYILKKLGLEPVTDYSMAARKMMFDVKGLHWSDELCKLLEKNSECFGKAMPSSTIIGRIKSFGRIELPTEVEVVLGAHDAMCGFLGLGVRPDVNGVLANNAGTYNLIGTLTNHAFKFNSSDVTPGCGPIAGSFHYQAGGMIGPTLDWCVNRFGNHSVGKMFEQAVFDGSCKVHMDQDPMSGHGIFSGLSVTDGPVELFTGLVESITLPMKGWMERLQGTTDKGNFQKMRIGAGGAKSENWIQLKADLLEIPVEKVKNLQTSSVGVACICAVAKGIYGSYKEAVECMVQVERTFEPNPQMAERYRERYFEVYKK